MAARSQDKTGRASYYRYLPPNIPRAAIRRFARRIAEKFDPEKIILFGSFAHGTPNEDSDVDLLVVMPAYDEINQSIRIILAFEPVFPLDLIVRTPERLRRRLADGDSFLQEITTKGIVLYEKNDEGVGPKSGRGLARRQSRESQSRKHEKAKARKRRQKKEDRKSRVGLPSPFSCFRLFVLS